MATFFHGPFNVPKEIWMTELFKLNILDDLLLNTDRHICRTKNWFREGDHIAAADNGAFSFREPSELCNKDRFLAEILYPIKVFQKERGACPLLTKSDAQYYAL